MRKRIFQQRSQKEAEDAQEFLIARKRTVRNSATHKKNGDRAPSGLAQKVRPDFGLKHKNERWPHSVKRSADAKAPVKGKVNDRIGKGHPLTS